MIDGVKAAGVPEKNIIVWDQVEEYLVQYYLKKAGIKKYEPEGRPLVSPRIFGLEGLPGLIRGAHYMSSNLITHDANVGLHRRALRPGLT